MKADRLRRFEEFLSLVPAKQEITSLRKTDQFRSYEDEKTCIQENYILNESTCSTLNAPLSRTNSIYAGEDTPPLSRYNSQTNGFTVCLKSNLALSKPKEKENCLPSVCEESFEKRASTSKMIIEAKSQKRLLEMKPLFALSSQRKNLGNSYRGKMLDILKNEGNTPIKSIKSLLTVSPKFNLLDEYDIGDVIGEGASSIVRKIIRKKDCKAFALKSYKTVQGYNACRTEPFILKSLNHPGVIKLEHSFCSSTKVRRQLINRPI